MVHCNLTNRDVRDKRHKHTNTDRYTLKRYHHSGSNTELMRTLSSPLYFTKSYNTYNIVDIKTFHTRERERERERESEGERWREEESERWREREEREREN